MAGAEKSPGGRRRETCVRRLARAIRCANRAGADARPRGGAGRIRAQKGSGGGADGMERKGTRRRERYAGTEPQSFGGGMGNMTKHDTMQGSSMNRPGPRLSRSARQNGMNGDREGKAMPECRQYAQRGYPACIKHMQNMTFPDAIGSAAASPYSGRAEAALRWVAIGNRHVAPASHASLRTSRMGLSARTVGGPPASEANGGASEAAAGKRSLR